MDNAGEIVKLESKSNEIISWIGKQSEQLAKLYHDEGILNDKLSHLLKEDVSINRQLTSLVRALEAVSDVGIEYTVIGSIIELIPILINDCRVLVHSLYDGVLPTDVLNIVWKTGKHSHSSLKTVNSEVWVEHDMLSIVYYVPDFSEFTVFSLAFLPIRLETGSACVRVCKDQYVAAVGDRKSVV